jgi:hypothetical protein
MAEKKTYAGSIPNSGTANVKALFPAKTAKKGTVHKGKDLRAGKGK